MRHKAIWMRHRMRLELTRKSNILSFWLRCGTRPHKFGTEWDSNSLVKVIHKAFWSDVAQGRINGARSETCWDSGINNKTPNRMLTRRLSHTKCINASLRIGSMHPSGQMSKRKIIKINVANGKLSRQKLEGMVERRFLELAGRDINSSFLWTEGEYKKVTKKEASQIQ